MFTFETAGHLATEKGRTINFHHLAVEQRQREIWVVILPHLVFLDDLAFSYLLKLLTLLKY